MLRSQSADEEYCIVGRDREGHQPMEGDCFAIENGEAEAVEIMKFGPTDRLLPEGNFIDVTAKIVNGENGNDDVDFSEAPSSDKNGTNNNVTRGKWKRLRKSMQKKMSEINEEKKEIRLILDRCRAIRLADENFSPRVSERRKDGSKHGPRSDPRLDVDSKNDVDTATVPSAESDEAPVSDLKDFNHVLAIEGSTADGKRDERMQEKLERSRQVLEANTEERNDLQKKVEALYKKMDTQRNIMKKMNLQNDHLKKEVEEKNSMIEAKNREIGVIQLAFNSSQDQKKSLEKEIEKLRQQLQHERSSNSSMQRQLQQQQQQQRSPNNGVTQKHEHVASDEKSDKDNQILPTFSERRMIFRLTEFNTTVEKQPRRVNPKSEAPDAAETTETQPKEVKASDENGVRKNEELERFKQNLQGRCKRTKNALENRCKQTKLAIDSTLKQHGAEKNQQEASQRNGAEKNVKGEAEKNLIIRTSEKKEQENSLPIPRQERVERRENSLKKRIELFETGHAAVNSCK